MDAQVVQRVSTLLSNPDVLRSVLYTHFQKKEEPTDQKVSAHVNLAEKVVTENNSDAIAKIVKATLEVAALEKPQITSAPPPQPHGFSGNISVSDVPSTDQASICAT